MLDLSERHSDEREQLDEIRNEMLRFQQQTREAFASLHSKVRGGG